MSQEFADVYPNTEFPNSWLHTGCQSLHTPFTVTKGHVKVSNQPTVNMHVLELWKETGVPGDPDTGRTCRTTRHRNVLSPARRYELETFFLFKSSVLCDCSLHIKKASIKISQKTPAVWQASAYFEASHTQLRFPSWPAFQVSLQTWNYWCVSTCQARRKAMLSFR